jgi:signal transduction histidine kinase
LTRPTAASAATTRALAWAALALLDRPVNATKLADQFAQAGATLSEPVAAQLLEDLRARGLARVTQTAADTYGQHYARSIVGEQIVEGSIAGTSLDAELLELERLRGDLFAAVAHELRTPLTSIRTSVGLLLDPQTRAHDVQRQQMLRTIERNAERMQQHVEDVLDLTRFRTGHMRLTVRRFDARELPVEVVARLRPVIDARSQEVRFGSPGEPVFVYGDHRRLERALLNIVANAAKFSDEGAPIDIEVSQEGDVVTWAVVDRGPGLTEEERHRLFERFWVGSSDVGGTGLGLPLALAIAEAHGGGIDVETEPGRGSTFRLHIPVDPGSHGAGTGDAQ